MKPTITSILIVLIQAGLQSGFAADWPTYRFDARRSACSPAALPESLAVSWQRRFPSFTPAFAKEPRQQFDRSYQPVCADGILIVGSPVDGSVRAYAANDGRGLWCHYTDGPVRLAPVIHDGMVLVGSDDGTVRCLELQDGTCRWQRDLRPDGRPDLHLLGNNRLISQWPARGGPVVYENTLYVASGVWPTMGVTIHALTPTNGDVVWTNSRLSLMDHVRIDHNQLFEAGISPQGYLLAYENRLLVPNGRSHPLALERDDGSLFHFVQGYRHGDCRIALGGDYLFVGDRGVLSTVDFREVGNKWVRAGDKAPASFDASRFDQFEGPIDAYKHFAGCTADSVFDGSVAYSLTNGVFYAHDLEKAVLSQWEKKRGSNTLSPLRWDAPMRIRLPISGDGAGRLFLKAGNRLYGHIGNEALAIELDADNTAAEIVWRHAFNSRPTTMIAADERLFVTLSDGSLVCLASGEEPSDGGTPTAMLPPEPVATAEVTAVLEAVGPIEGICTVVGTLTPGETAAMLAGNDLRIVMISPSTTAVEQVRNAFGQTDLYGHRLEALPGMPHEQPMLPQYLASALWIRIRDTGPLDRNDLRQLWRSVHPYDGLLCVTGTPDQIQAVDEHAADSNLHGTRILHRSKRLLALKRNGGITGTANWTHETADAARTHYSPDSAVKGPLGPLWYGDGPGYGFVKRKDYGRGVKPQVVDGRVFALQQFSGTLVAYDAYTGRVLWNQRSNGGDRGPTTRFVSMPDGIYTAGGGWCIVRDPDTGKELRAVEYGRKMDPDSAARAAGIVVTDASIIIAGADTRTGAIEQGLWDATMLICCDRNSGEIRWTRRAEERFNIKALAAGDGTVFCTDSMSPLATDFWRRRGRDVDQVVSTVLALDEHSGTVRWTYQFSTPYTQHGASAWLSVRGTDDWLSYAKAVKQVIAGRRDKAAAVDARDGSVTWEKPMGLRQPLIVMGTHMMDQTSRWIDIRTGNVLREGLFQRGGCNYAVASRHLALLREHTVCYVDLDDGERHRLRNMRSGCSNSIIPACGVVSIPNFSLGCVCNYPVQASSAWVHMPGIEEWGGTDPLTVQPVQGDTHLPVVDPDVALAMHRFERRYLVKDLESATQHLIGHWTFEPKKETAPQAETGNQVTTRDCEIMHPAFEPGRQGRALSCRGDQARTAGRATIAPETPIRHAVTLAAWIKLGDRQHKGAAGLVECQQTYRLMVANTTPPYRVSFSLRTDRESWRNVQTPASLAPDTWYHIAATFDGETGELIIFVDGKPVSKSSGTPCRLRDGGPNIFIGLRDGTAYLTGAIDEVRVYDRALAPALIASMGAQ